MKNIVLIRHGESLGQTARHRGLSRSDPSLIDCFLTNKGIQQASQLRSNSTLNQYDFDLICVSPLSRALSTCVLALGHIVGEDCDMEEESLSSYTETDSMMEEPQKEQSAKQLNRVTPFIAHADICELGDKIPENYGRPVHRVVKDLKGKLSRRSSQSSVKCLDKIDFSMLPPSWPEKDDNACIDGIEIFLSWLASRPEENVAIVCHYNVIKWMLRNTISQVPNCVPIECVLTDNGYLMLKSEFDSVGKSATLDMFGLSCNDKRDTGKESGKKKNEKYLRRQKR